MINILKHRDENLVRLYKYFLPYKGKIAVASIFLIATALTSSATATLLGKLTDVSFYQGGSWLVFALPAALIAVTLVFAISTVLSAYIMSQISQSVLVTLRKELFYSVLHWPESQYQKVSTGLISSKFVNESIFIQISFIAITIFANQRGLNDAAAVGIVEKIIGILFLVPSSMLSTISALASQNIGAGKHDRARLTLRYVLCMTVGYGLVAATIVQFVSVPFVGLFTNDGAVQILGGQYLRSYAWDCVFAGVHFCLSGYFYAYGLSIVSFIHNSISIICARIPLSYYAATHFPDTLFPMGCAAPAGSIISIIICVGVLIWMNKHTEKYMERT